MNELDRPCLGRDAELDLGLRALERHGALWITGAPGIGKTHVATALSARLPGPGVVVSLAGCAGRADVVRAFGDAIGVFPCGDESAVRAGAGARWVLADDVSASTCEALLGLELQGPLMLVGAGLSEPAAGVSGACIVLEELPLECVQAFAPGAQTGNPLHATLAHALECAPDALAERLAGGRPWVGLPMGLGMGVIAGIPRVALRADARGRTTLRAGVAALLYGDGRGWSASPEATAAAFVRQALRDVPERREALRSAAFGTPPVGVHDPRDILLLRLLAQNPDRSVDDGRGDTIAVWAAAVGARLAIQAGQVGEARAMVRAVRASDDADHGLLRWVDGDAMLAMGDVAAARASWLDAEHHLDAAVARGTGDAAREAWIALMLTSAQHLALRGHEALTASFVMRARGMAREARPPRLLDVAASWRASAGLAAASGEALSASQFLAEAAGVERVVLPTEPARGAPESSVVIEVSVLASEGRTAEAHKVLSAFQSDDPLVRANLIRRRADLYLREGASARAGRAAREAAALYASVGEHVSSAQSLRVAADALALSGHLEEAANLYVAVITQQVRLQDLGGLERSLLRAAMVDEARGALDSAALRRSQLAAVQRARS